MVRAVQPTSVCLGWLRSNNSISLRHVIPLVTAMLRQPRKKELKTHSYGLGPAFATCELPSWTPRSFMITFVKREQILCMSHQGGVGRVFSKLQTPVNFFGSKSRGAWLADMAEKPRDPFFLKAVPFS